MEVDVPNACGTITDPAAPMALRLQGNLLFVLMWPRLRYGANMCSFGVSRVFSQQCAYILTDTENLRDKVRGVATFLKDLEVDPNVVAAR